MNAPVHDVLHDAFDRESRTVAPPTGLAQTAIARYQRQRRIRTTLAGVGALTVAAVVAVPLVTNVAASERSPVATAGASKKMVVTAQAGIGERTLATTAGTSFTRIGPTYSSLLLNTRTGRYDRLPYARALPSPDGRWAVVQTGGTDPDDRPMPNRTGVLNRANGQVRWLDHDTNHVDGPGSWSPDSTRFLLSERPGAEQGNIVLVDAATLATKVIAVPDLLTRNAMGLEMVWAPSGDRLLLTLSRLNQDETEQEVFGIQEYDLTGKPSRTISVEGKLRTAAQFSPDGTRVVLFYPDEANPAVVDLATGATIVAPTPVDAQAGISAAFVGWYDSDHLAYQSGTGSPGSPVKLLIVSTQNKVVRTVPLPDPSGGDAVYLSPAGHLTGPAAKLAF
jgi:hypothetical protein